MENRSRFQFVNRLSEREKLGGELATFEGRNARLVVGRSGVGKSALMAQVLRDQRLLPPAFKIDVRLAASGATADGLFLSRLCSAIDRRAETDHEFETLEEFALTKVGKEALTEAVRAATDLLVITKILMNIHEAMEKRRAAAKSFLDNFSDSQTVEFMQEYATRQLHRGRFVLNIENIQSVDDLSKKAIEAILGECHEYFLVGEYTTDTHRGYAISDVIEYLEQRIDKRVMVTYLDSLGPEAVRNIPILPSSHVIETINKRLDSWDGNIRSIKDLVVMVDSEPLRPGSMVLGTEARIAALGKDARWLLIVICAHQGPAPTGLAEEAYEAGPTVLSFADAIDELGDFVEITDTGEMQVQHDSIDAIISDSRGYRGALGAAMGLWNEIYRAELINQSPRVTSATALIRILYFSCTVQDFVAILDILERLRQEALRSRNPRYLIDQIARLQVLAVPVAQRRAVTRVINQWLVDMYHNTDRPLEALSCLETIGEDTAIDRFWTALLLEQSSQHEAARQHCLDGLSTCVNDSSSYTLRLKLILMQAEFCLGHFQAVQRLYRELLLNEDYQSAFEYGFVLRNSTYLTDRALLGGGIRGITYQEAVSYLAQSVEHFQRFGGLKQIASSRNTLAIYLALCGEFDEAQGGFQLALEESAAFLGSKNWMLNNLAVLHHFRGDLEGAERLAKAGLRYANDDFDRLALYINLLVASIRRNDDAGSVVARIEEIVQSPSFADTEILRYAHFNLSKYYSSRGLASLSRQSIQRFRLFGEVTGSHWNRWLRGIDIEVGDPEFYRATLEWPLSFNDGWGIEFDKNLMQFE